ncbi:MAG: tetratricopeptide repeat protein [Planctomycetota bacterium]|jgi:tetratricopeptide (TPR) repeat protein
MSRSSTVRGGAGTVCLLVALGSGAAPVVAELPPDERHLAVEIERAAMVFLDGSVINVETIDAALLLLDEAVACDPENIDLWRTILTLTSLAEREDATANALRRVIELDPTDEMARLRRLAEFVDRGQTVETRIEAYGKLLAPATRAQLGPAVSSRLALDLAHLYRRAGDVDAFSQWLGEAVALDPSNRAAAALAAGYFRLLVDDPYGEAELLVSLILADPTDPGSLATLAELLLRHGAFRSAARIYRLAASCQRIREGAASSDLLADFAIALWAGGESIEALAMIRDHQQRVNEDMRLRLRIEHPETPLAEITGSEQPLTPTIAAVRALILTEAGDERGDGAVTRLIDSFEREIELAQATDPPDEQAIATFRLQLALVLVWAGREPARVNELLAAAETFQPLSEIAQRRFGGWRVLQSGDPVSAETMLSTHAESDPASALGLAMALLQQDRPADAARQFLALARAEPGTLLGAWAVNSLAEIVGQRTPVSDLAARLDALIDTIPRQFDRLPESPTFAVSLRLRPRRLTTDPYEPIIVDIELSNHSRHPLAIDRDGPIRPQVLLRPTAQLLTGRPAEDFSSVIVDLDRRLRLDPGETLVVPFDLRRTWVGRVMNEYAVAGGLIQLEAILNFTTNASGSFTPDLLGSRTEARLIRVEGVRADEVWMRDAAERVRDPATPDRLRTLALLCNLLGTGGGRGVNPIEMSEAVRTAAAAAVAEVFPTLSPASQAWLLAVSPQGATPEAATLEDLARRSDERLVRLAYLLFHLDGPDDPMIDAARRSGDPLLAAVADALQPLLRRALETGAGDGAPATPPGS